MTKEITSISVQKHDPTRLNICLEGEYAFSLDRLTAVWLKVGQKLSEQEIKTLRERDEQEVAFNRALRYLSYRARSESELMAFLGEKGYPDFVSQAVVDRLKEEGLINDMRFADDWIDNRVSFRPRSQTQLRAELRRKGLEEEIINSALQNANLDDLSLARKAGIKLARRYTGATWLDFRQKMVAALGRRGFNFETANTITRQLFEEMHAQNPSCDE